MGKVIKKKSVTESNFEKLERQVQRDLDILA